MDGLRKVKKLQEYYQFIRKNSRFLLKNRDSGAEFPVF